MLPYKTPLLQAALLKTGVLLQKLPCFLLLSEGRTVVKCISECNQSGCRLVFDPEPVAMSTNYCAWSVFLQRKRVVIVSAALCHESHSPGASYNFSKKLWQFPPEQIVQTYLELESIVRQKTGKIQVKWKDKLTSCTKKS